MADPTVEPPSEKIHNQVSYAKDGETCDQTHSQSDSGEVVSQPWYRRALRHWKHLVYAVIWLLFTG